MNTISISTKLSTTQSDYMGGIRPLVVHGVCVCGKVVVTAETYGLRAELESSKLKCGEECER